MAGPTTTRQVDAVRAVCIYLQALFNLGNLQRQCGDFEGAIANYETVLELAPDHWRGLLNYSVALIGVGREAQAKAALRRAFQLSGKLPFLLHAQDS